MTRVPRFPVELIECLRSADHISVMTGAGISAESGIPTFRDAQTGLWAKYDPHQLATPQAFHRNPGLVWDWYAWRRQLIAGAEPNAGHLALAQLGLLVENFTLITQNIDGLHTSAGSRNVIELHGNIWRTKCSREDKVVTAWSDEPGVPPTCPHCGAFLRPDVIWFGESVPEGVLRSAVAAAETSSIFFSVGTSAIVQPAASLAHHAQTCGARLVEINLEPTLLTRRADFAFSGPAGEILPALVESLSR